MLLSLVLHTYSMRYVLPAAVMLGTAPTYMLAWGAWRLLAALLPARFYHEVDDRLYTLYQSMVLFFFENYTGVQVRFGQGRQRGWEGGGAAGSVPSGGTLLCRRRPPSSFFSFGSFPCLFLLQKKKGGEERRVRKCIG